MNPEAVEAVMSAGLAGFTILILVLLAIWSVIYHANSGLGEESGESLRQFADALQGGQLIQENAFFGSPDIVRGRLESGREAELKIAGGQITYSVRLAGNRRTLMLSAGRLEEELAELQFQHGGRSEQVKEIDAALRELFGLLSMRGVTLEEGWLRVRREAFDYATSVTSLQRVFDRLDTVAPLLETSEVQVRVLANQPTLAWKPRGQAICPFCRDDLDLEAEALEACPECNTVQHAECLAEAGGCSVFACRGGPQRDRLHA